MGCLMTFLALHSPIEMSLISVGVTLHWNKRQPERHRRSQAVSRDTCALLRRRWQVSLLPYVDIVIDYCCFARMLEPGRNAASFRGALALVFQCPKLKNFAGGTKANASAKALVCIICSTVWPGRSGPADAAVVPTSRDRKRSESRAQLREPEYEAILRPFPSLPFSALH